MDKFKGCFLNMRLVEKQELSDIDTECIQNLHELKHYLFQFMIEIDDENKLKELAKLVEVVEFKLQKTWKFKEDRNMHDWFKVPKCICPKSDNEDMKGTPYRRVVQNCKNHGVKQS